MALTTPMAGYGGIVKVGATDINVSRWNLDMHNGLQEFTNTSSGGYEEFIRGVTGATGTVSGHHDNSAVLVTSVYAGASVAMTLTLGTGSKTFSCNGIVETVKYTNEVKGITDYEFTFKSTGSITLPT